MQAALKFAWMLPFTDRIQEALRKTEGARTYVPGVEVSGEELRSFSEQAVITGPLVCQLCDADFITEGCFVKHKECEHAGEKEYRKRVLWLLAKFGCRPITGQEKRLMVQNFAHFQQFSHPGAKGNYYADCDEVPRAEAACAVCACKDWLEHRHKLSLFGCPPFEAYLPALALHRAFEKRLRRPNVLGDRTTCFE